jgi:hypothetical protein
MIFTADAATDVINFLSLGGPDGLPPFVLLDGIVVNPTPEPGSLALMLGGVLGGVGLLKWRKRMKRRSEELTETVKCSIES